MYPRTYITSPYEPLSRSDGQVHAVREPGPADWTGGEEYVDSTHGSQFQDTFAGLECRHRGRVAAPRACSHCFCGEFGLLAAAVARRAEGLVDFGGAGATG